MNDELHAEPQKHPVSHEAIMARLEAGDRKFDQLAADMKAIRDAVAPIPQMRTDVAATKEIVEAWGAIKTIGKIITNVGKFVGGVVLIASAMFALLKLAVMQIPRG